jgi:hypothetical protein
VRARTPSSTINLRGNNGRPSGGRRGGSRNSECRAISIITFFDGYDSDVIAYAAPYLATEYHLDRVMIGNIFGSLALIFTAIVISLIPHDMMYGPQAALIAESVRSVTSSPRSSPGVRRP